MEIFKKEEYDEVIQKYQNDIVLKNSLLSEVEKLEPELEKLESEILATKMLLDKSNEALKTWESRLTSLRSALDAVGVLNVHCVHCTANLIVQEINKHMLGCQRDPPVPTEGSTEEPFDALKFSKKMYDEIMQKYEDYNALKTFELSKVEELFSDIEKLESELLAKKTKLEKSKTTLGTLEAGLTSLKSTIDAFGSVKDI